MVSSLVVTRLELGNTGAGCPSSDISTMASIMIELMMAAPAMVDAGPTRCPNRIEIQSCIAFRNACIDSEVGHFK